MLAVKKNIDFFEQVRADTKITGLSGKRTPFILPLCAVILPVLICWGIFSLLGFNAGQRLSAIGANLSGIENPAGFSDGYNAPAIEDMLKMELDYNDGNRLTSGRLKEIFALQPDDLSVLGVTYYDNVITIDAWSARELCGADFAKLLSESGAFSGVSYNGVIASDNGYSFTISFNFTGEIY